MQRPRSTLELPFSEFSATGPQPVKTPDDFKQQLEEFKMFGEATRMYQTKTTLTNGRGVTVDTFVNEFWTAQQRRGHSLHEISYRACFKPQLPRFFIERLTTEGDTVYDPFMGRGTTVLEAALLGRKPLGCDANPLSAVLVSPRLLPPRINEVANRLQQIDFAGTESLPTELLAFYHPDTLREICALRSYLLKKQNHRTLNHIDAWIRMVAVNRLTGHSPGFFSVYTLPPNQAVSVESQIRINQRRGQRPSRRNVPELILRKSEALLSDCDEETRRMLGQSCQDVVLLTKDASSTAEIKTSSVSLVVTSPPFLDIVDYESDNWLRCWFCGIDPKRQKLTIVKALDKWQAAMRSVFAELVRILKPNGYVAFEVGEVRRGTIKLEQAVVPSGVSVGLKPVLILINDQEFTKTSNCWGVQNQVAGTNTNRVVLFRK
jgi:DNA methylase